MTRGEKFLRNIGWLLGGRIVIMILQFLVSLATARFLGPTNFGTINYVAAYVSFFSSIASLGLAVVVIKEIAQNREKANSIIWTSIWMRLAVAVISTISVVTLMCLGDRDDPLITKISFFQSLSILFSAFDTINYYFQATLNAKWGSIASIFAYIAMSLYRICLLMWNASVEWFALASSLDLLILIVFLFAFYVRLEGFEPCFDWQMGKRLLKQSRYYLVAGLMSILLEQIDRIMIGYLLDRASVGIYSAMLTISSIWSVIPSALTQSVAPILYETAKTDRGLYLRRLRQTYASLFWINALYSIAVCVLGSWIIRILYGEAYTSGIYALRIVVWFYGISTMGNMSSIYLANDYKDKYINIFTLTGLILDVVLNSLLIPMMGICGAAIATLMTQIAVNLVIPFFITDIRELAVEIVRGIILKEVLSQEEARVLRIKIESKFKKKC